VQFEGNTVVETKALEEIARPYLGRAIDDADIEELRRKLTLHYVNRGYASSGVLVVPGSPDSTSVLRFRVIEGRVSQIRVRGLERLSEDYVEYRLVPDPAAPLNIDELRERFQLLLSDPLFARINVRIVPDVQPGLAALELDVERARPYQLTTFFNNYRPPAIGSEAIGLNAQVRNLTGLGDVITLGWQDAPHGISSARSSIGWHIPVGRHGTTVYGQADQGRSSVIEEPLNILNINSVLRSAEVGVIQPLFETTRHRLALGLSYSSRANRTTVLDVPFSFTPGVPEGEMKAKTIKFNQDYTHKSESAALALRSSFVHTHDNLLAPAGGATNGDTIPEKYGFWVGQGYFAKRLTDGGVQAVLRGTSQVANRRLLPLDGLAIGGVNTVRGYRENQLLRDRGQVLALELGIPLLDGPGPERPVLTMSPFLDWGRGQNAYDAATILSSTGLALRLDWYGFRGEFAFAKRLQHPGSADALRGTWQDRGVHFQLSYAVF